ncbi:hypothetical protein Cgig2_024980 [Carnegiea gigantea]|uniref:Uncharacterized protein n=1 Tax=Carnegiea gigantea TaxID=171969 RepID=A0A9Q1JRI6_9CARY|nr:hypothetical protein Cgig2_024980 [Carnegiea gigantea]
MPKKRSPSVNLKSRLKEEQAFVTVRRRQCYLGTGESNQLKEGALDCLNEAQAEAVRSMCFAPFLKVDVNQIPGKFFKWLVESFDLYAKFLVTAFNVHAILGVPLGGTEIIEITKSSMDDEYDEKANNDLYAPSFSLIVPLDKPDGEAEIPGDTLVFDASIIVEKEEHLEDVVLD